MAHKFPLNNKIVLITGSSRGIGKSIALASAKAGANIVVTYNKEEQCAIKIAEKINKLKRQALVLCVSVYKRISVKKMINRVISDFGRIDILVNNAGILKQKPFLEITDNDWFEIMNVNLMGTFICSQEVFPIMQQQRFGRIINIASSGGQLGGPLAVHYSASKAGVICLTKSLARIGAPYNILVNCISPGLIDTEMTRDEIVSTDGKFKIQQIPISRPGTADEVAAAAVFLASDKASYITGQTINVNGGLYLG